jgi:hypothetical protein
MSLLDLVATQTGLTPEEIDELCVRTDRIKNGSVRRDDWANVEVLMIMAKGPQVVREIAAGGAFRFMRTVKPILADHGFTFADYLRMYTRIRAKAERG